MSDLEKRVKKIEGILDINEIAKEDMYQVFSGHTKESERAIKERETQLVSKYGPDCLDKILFVVVRCFCKECMPDKNPLVE